MRTCCDCGRGPRQGLELRPYGPQGKPICFPCSQATPERRREAKAQMRARFGALGASPGILTEDGPQAADDVVARLTCARCGHPPTTAEGSRIVALLERTAGARLGPPAVRGFVCDGCGRTAPVVCARCSQPIDGVAQVGDDGRPRHEGDCPDWVRELAADRDARRAVDEADRVAAVSDALERIELESLPEPRDVVARALSAAGHDPGKGELGNADEPEAD